MSRTLTARISVAAAAAWLIWNVGLAATDSAPAPNAAPAQPATTGAAQSPGAALAGGATAAAHSGAAAQAKSASKSANAAGSDTPQNGPPGASQNWPMLKQYCEKCHNAEDWAGNIAFDT